MKLTKKKSTQRFAEIFVDVMLCSKLCELHVNFVLVLFDLSVSFPLTETGQQHTHHFHPIVLNYI